MSNSIQNRSPDAAAAALTDVAFFWVVGGGGGREITGKREKEKKLFRKGFWGEGEGIAWSLKPQWSA